MKYLDNSSILTKLTLGFGILILSLAIVAIVSISSLNFAEQDYREYRSLARQANADGQVQANMLTTRIFVKDFVIDPTDESIAGVNERARVTIELINEAISLAGNSVFEGMLVSINEDLNEYIDYFKQVSELQATRNELVLNTLNRVGPITEKNLTDIMQSSLIDADTEASYLAGLSVRSLLLGRLYATRFLIQNTEAAYDRAILEFKNMDRELNELDQILENSARRSLLNNATANKAIYLNSLTSVHDIILRRNDIIENRLDRIGPRIADEIENLTLAIQSEQDLLGPVAQANLEHAQILTISLTLLAISFAIAVAVLIARIIVRPLTEITDAADTMASGDMEVEIKTGRRDEIGRLASAFVAMRDAIGEKVNALQNEITTREAAEHALQKEREELEFTVKERTAEAETARRNAEDLRDAAEFASRSKAEFLATMSHEIRTPMNGIIGMVDLLRQSELSDNHRQMVQTIADSGQSLLTIINDVLDFSKIEADKLRLEEIDFSILETVESSIETIKGDALKKGLHLLTYIDPRIPPLVVGDPVRIRQIMINLGGNAIKFTGYGRIVIRADLIEEDEVSHTIRFRVIDNGIGISQVAQKDLFQAFTQAESSTTRKHGGTGLGLSICHRLVQLMNGVIGVNSDLGEGSDFYFKINFKKSEKLIVTDQERDFSNLRVLVVAQEKIQQFVCQQYLEYWNAEVLTLDDISQLTERAKTHSQRANPIDIVIICSDWSPVQQLHIREKFRRDPMLEHINFLILMRGRRTRPRFDNPETVQLDVSPMRRVRFLTAVAIAACRASPEVYFEEEIEDLKSTTTALSVEEAIEQNTLILVAEDNPVNQQVILQQVALLGYTCELAHDGEEALRAWNTGRYFLLLTDCHMPVMDGYDLTKAIRLAERGQSNPRAPIIAITASALRDEVEKCHSTGMDDHLSKPFDMKALKSKLRRWMPHFNPDSHTDLQKSIGENLSIDLH